MVYQARHFTKSAEIARRDPYHQAFAHIEQGYNPFEVWADILNMSETEVALSLGLSVASYRQRYHEYSLWPQTWQIMGFCQHSGIHPADLVMKTEPIPPSLQEALYLILNDDTYTPWERDHAAQTLDAEIDQLHKTLWSSPPIAPFLQRVEQAWQSRAGHTVMPDIPVRDPALAALFTQARSGDEEPGYVTAEMKVEFYLDHLRERAVQARLKRNVAHMRYVDKLDKLEELGHPLFGPDRFYNAFTGLSDMARDFASAGGNGIDVLEREMYSDAPPVEFDPDAAWQIVDYGRERPLTTMDVFMNRFRLYTSSELEFTRARTEAAQAVQDYETFRGWLGREETRTFVMSVYESWCRHQGFQSRFGTRPDPSSPAAENAARPV